MYGQGLRIDDGRVVPHSVIQVLEIGDLTICGDGKQTRSSLCDRSHRRRRAMRRIECNMRAGDECQ